MSSRLCKFQDRCRNRNCHFIHEPTSYSNGNHPKNNAYRSQNSTGTHVSAPPNGRYNGHFNHNNRSRHQSMNDHVYLPDVSSTPSNSSQTPPVTMDTKKTHCELGSKCTELYCFYKHPYGREIDRNAEMIQELKNIARMEEQWIDKIENLLTEALIEQQEQQKCDTNDEESSETDSEQFVYSVEQQLPEELKLQKKEFQSAIDMLTEQLKPIAFGDRGHRHNLLKLQRIEQQLLRELNRWDSRLPIYAQRRVIIEKLRQNQVLILKADTGSGKSTQIVQYLYDENFAESSKSIFFLKIFSINHYFRTNHLDTTTQISCTIISCSSSRRIRMSSRRRGN